MVGIFLAVFLCKRSMQQYREGFFSLGWSRQLVRRLTTLGTPIALEMGMETASFSLSIVMVGWLGTIALASHQVMSTITARNMPTMTIREIRVDTPAPTTPDCA